MGQQLIGTKNEGLIEDCMRLGRENSNFRGVANTRNTHLFRPQGRLLDFIDMTPKYVFLTS